MLTIEIESDVLVCIKYAISLLLSSTVQCTSFQKQMSFLFTQGLFDLKQQNQFERNHWEYTVLEVGFTMFFNFSCMVAVSE